MFTIFKVALLVGTIFLAPVSIPAKLILAYPMDVAINTVTGGTPGKTISGDTARARTRGDKEAVRWCDLYTVVAPYDYVTGVYKLGSDHCSRWEAYEALPYDPNMYKGLNK